MANSNVTAWKYVDSVMCFAAARTFNFIQFFNKYGYPFEVVNCLENMQKREALSQMTNWPTLPKVFIDGKFYGDTDILDEMESKGEVEPELLFQIQFLYSPVS